MKRIIVIGGEKGGVGKSSLAQSISYFLRKEDIILVDADPQGTSISWSNERRKNKDLPPVECIQASEDIAEILRDLNKKYKTIIVDPGGQDSKALRSSLSVATHHLLPLRPKRRDLKTLPHAVDLIEMAKACNHNLISKAVITQCPCLPSQFYRIQQAKEACKSFDLVTLNSVTMNRNSYDDCDEDGFTVLETSDQKAIEEMTNLIKEFLEI